jgi:hypothetical protein
MTAASSRAGIFEIMHTTRSMRRLKPDPVPNKLIGNHRNGVAAANGRAALALPGGQDPLVKGRGGLLQAPGRNVARFRTRSPGTSTERFQRLCSRLRTTSPSIFMKRRCGSSPASKVPRQRSAGSSIYPAVQNMLLAARALGLGATLTTLHLRFEKETEEALGLPPDVHSYALLPIGYPMGRFGPVARAPLADFVYQDRWGEPSRDL